MDRRNRCHAGAFCNQPLLGCQCGDGAPQVGLVDDHELMDEVAHEIERHRVRVEIAGEAIRQRRLNIYMHDPAGREAPGEWTGGLDLYAQHTRR